MSSSPASGDPVRAILQSASQLNGLARDAADLVRQEVQLARQETIEKLSPAARALAMIVGGGVLGAFGAGYLLQAIVRALATIMPRWLASLVSGVALTGAAGALAALGARQLKDLNIVPERTIRTLKEDREWLLRQLRSRLR